MRKEAQPPHSASVGPKQGGVAYYYFQESVRKPAPDHEIAGESAQPIGETLRPVWGLMDKCYPVTAQRRRVRSGKKQASEAVPPRATGGPNGAAEGETDVSSQHEGAGRAPEAGAAGPVAAGKEMAEEEEVAGRRGGERRTCPRPPLRPFFLPRKIKTSVRRLQYTVPVRWQAPARCRTVPPRPQRPCSGHRSLLSDLLAWVGRGGKKSREPDAPSSPNAPPASCFLPGSGNRGPAPRAGGPAGRFWACSLRRPGPGERPSRQGTHRLACLCFPEASEVEREEEGPGAWVPQLLKRLWLGWFPAPDTRKPRNHE
ncbi:uncharacterized protein LOC144226452 isoform X2 [Crocuta crocuta]